jgi:hypothetical protein
MVVKVVYSWLKAGVEINACFGSYEGRVNKWWAVAPGMVNDEAGRTPYIYNYFYTFTMLNNDLSHRFIVCHIFR